MNPPTMNLREEIIAVMIQSDMAAERDKRADDYDIKLDALLDWIDTNAERIADDPDHTGDAVIRYLVVVLQERTAGER